MWQKFKLIYGPKNFFPPKDKNCHFMNARFLSLYHSGRAFKVESCFDNCTTLCSCAWSIILYSCNLDNGIFMFAYHMHVFMHAYIKRVLVFL